MYTAVKNVRKPESRTRKKGTTNKFFICWFKQACELEKKLGRIFVDGTFPISLFLLTQYKVFVILFELGNPKKAELAL